ncbi:hypothetical protein [Clostridium lundense]|uniref:hypothetical protein n=1 Tax=Clostridium lundense TaxID=319475 RepID=UPI00047F992E|nr:hypothetical protein [Clostridium lundense]
MKIEAYFSGIKNANEAVEKLKFQGFNNAIVDLNDHTINYNNNEDTAKGITASSLSSVVMNSGNISDDITKMPLLAASPMASGMGSFEEITDINYKVILDIDSNELNKAKGIITNMGGDFKNPNLDINNSVENIDI